ncbi:MAG: spore coat protein [Firmicutes bacterium]|nr:spore coat protein [Bacillota bacterium]
MKQGAREAMVLSEVLRTNSSIIDHYNLYLGNCQDQQLRAILDRQQRHSLDTFQRLLQMAQNHGIDTSTMPLPATLSTGAGGAQGVPGTTGAAQYGAQMPTPQYGGMQQQNFTGHVGMQYGAGYTAGNQAAPGMPAAGPQTVAQPGSQVLATLNDRVIAEGALMFHKCGAETHTRAALESSEPHLRNALANMSRNCVEMSYEIYNFMSQRGWYQLPATPQNFISHSTAQQQHPTQ